MGQKEVAVARVTVEITRPGPFTSARFNESEKDSLIGDISLNKTYINKMGVPRGDMKIPGISVALFSNKTIISDWNSVPLNDKGTYEMIIGLEGQVKEGDVIRMAVYVIDDRGEPIIGKRKDVVWN